MLHGSVKGSDEARRAARDLRKAASRELTREIRAGVRDAIKPLQPAVATSAAQTLPSGYGRPVLAPAMRVKSTTTLAVSRGVGVKVTIYAAGRKELRDVVAVNLGRLRHPVWGNRKVWSTTRVLPGFVDEPVRLLEKQVAQKIDAAASRVAEKVERGTI